MAGDSVRISGREESGGKGMRETDRNLLDQRESDRVEYCWKVRMIKKVIKGGSALWNL